MPETLTHTERPAPLVALTEDETLFRDNIRQFADDAVRPLVKEMDEKAVFDHDLIHKFFELGLMGIESPEEFGGQGGAFFQSVLAVEELSRVDPSAGVIVDVQNTLVEQRAAALGQRRTEAALSAAAAHRATGRVCAVRSRLGSDAFALATRAD